jgi:AraC-like DNA-binding protein
MSTLEAALRGGAVAILLLSVVLRARYMLVSRLISYSVLLLLGVAAFVVDSAPGFNSLDPRLKIPIHIISSGTPAVFWFMSAALFDDEFTARWYHGLAWLWLAVLAWREMFGWHPTIETVHNVSALLCVLFGIWHALAGRAADLVERRRQFRLEFAISTAAYTVLIIASQWIWPGTLGKPPFSIINAFGLIAMTFVFFMFGPSRLAAEGLVPGVPHGGLAPTANGASAPAPPKTGQDAVLLEALRKLMENDKAYRQDGLSIALLSQSLGIQEYRLRRLINGQLGHRNFSAFVNGYRLAEAAAALADPGQAEVPILTIALDSGFGSIGPFNRAFKAYAGLTPTEYRRAHLGGAEAGSPIPESASRS